MLLLAAVSGVVANRPAPGTTTTTSISPQTTDVSKGGKTRPPTGRPIPPRQRHQENRQQHREKLEQRRQQLKQKEEQKEQEKLVKRDERSGEHTRDDNNPPAVSHIPDRTSIRTITVPTNVPYVTTTRPPFWPTDLPWPPRPIDFTRIPRTRLTHPTDVVTVTETVTQSPTTFVEVFTSDNVQDTTNTEENYSTAIATAYDNLGAADASGAGANGQLGSGLNASTGVIIGAVAGVIAFIGLVVLGTVIYKKKNRQDALDSNNSTMKPNAAAASTNSVMTINNNDQFASRLSKHRPSVGRV